MEKAIAVAKTTEIRAELLEYQNCHFDVTKEQEKETKKEMRTVFGEKSEREIIKSEWTTKELPDGTLMISSYKGKMQDIVTPTAVGEMKITRIGEYAFSPEANCRNKDHRRNGIKSVVVSEGITQIDMSAFRLCWGLEMVTLPQSMEKIVYDAFCLCGSLQKVIIQNSKTIIGESVFSSSKAVTICEPVGSYAELYARKNRIPFEAI